MSIADIQSLCDDMQKNNNVKIRVLKSKNGEVRVVYVKQLCDINLLSEHIIKPVQHYWLCNDTTISARLALNSIITADDCALIDDEQQIREKVLSGMAVVLFSDDTKGIEVNLKKVEKKSTDASEINYSIWGGKDSFTENLDSNLSLIRYRIKDPSLKLDMYTVGRRTKTMLLMAYIGDVANEEYVNAIKKRIEKIDIDGILESAKLQWFLNDNKFGLFPQAGLEQRSDIACGAMLEGKIVLLLDGSGIALILPKLLVEFLWSDDDECDNIYFGIFSKVLRILSVFISATITSFYMALTGFHAGALPTVYSMMIASARAGVPFSVVTEVILIELLVEILRESLLRVPRSIGSAMGIVGGIVIGQASVEAGLFSPVVLVLAALSLMSSYIVPDYNLTNAVRMIKFVFIIFTAFFGLFGLVCGLFLITLTLISDTTLKTPYFAPYAPFRFSDAIKGIFTNKYLSMRRPDFLKTKNKIRQKKQE